VDGVGRTIRTSQGAKRLKAKKILKRRVSYIRESIIIVLQNMQVLIPLFVLLVVDVKSMSNGSTHYVDLAISLWMKRNKEST
jgi:hypothetical protein